MSVQFKEEDKLIHRYWQNQKKGKQNFENKRRRAHPSAKPPGCAALRLPSAPLAPATFSPKKSPAMATAAVVPRET